MKKTIILTVAMFLLIIGLATAEHTLNNTVISCFDFNSTADMNDTYNNNSLDITGGTSVELDPPSSCIHGSCLNFSGVDTFFKNTTGTFPNTGNWSWSFWMNVSKDSQTGIWKFGKLATSENMRFYMGGTDLRLSNNGDDWEPMFDYASYLNNWTHIVVTYNNATKNQSLYIDGAFVKNRTTANVIKIGIGSFVVGTNDGEIEIFAGKMDSFIIHHKKYTDAEVEYLFNSGGGRACSDFNSTITVDTIAPVITWVYPTFNYTYNDSSYDGWINFTTDENANCSLNRTDWENNSLINSTHFFYNNSDYANLADGKYNFNFTCWDSLNNNGSTIFVFGLDNTIPTLVSSMALNDTLTGGTLNNFTFQFNYSDNLKISSINITGFEYSYSETNINTTSYSFNGTVNLENYSVGLHYLNTTFCDSHTAFKIDDYDYKIDKMYKKLKYNFDDDYITIKPKESGQFEDIKTRKKRDRYSFDFTKKKGFEGGLETYIIRSSQKISIVGDDTYKGWLIIYRLNKWIDFENEGGYPVTIKRISDYEVEVVTEGTKFSSVGDLNCITEKFEFYHFKYEANYSADVYETESETFKLIVNKTDITVTNYTGYLIRDGVLYNTTATNSTNYINFTSTITIPYITSSNITSTFYWNYTLNTTGTEFDFNTSVYNQTTYQTNLYVCGGITNTTTLNFTIWDSKDENSINATLDGWFKNYKTTPTVYRNRSFSFTEAYAHAICIYPTTASYYSDFIIEYAQTGYDTRSYIKRNFSLNSTVQDIKLYLLSEPNSTAITVNVVDEFGDPIFERIVESWEYSIANNTFDLVSVEETDEEGTVIMYLDTTRKHQFIIKDQEGIIIYTSASMKLYQTEYTFTIVPEITDELQNILTGVIRTLTISNVSSNYSVSYTWTDNGDLLSKICLMVTNSTLNDTTSLYDSCSTATEGTLSTSLIITGGHYPVIGYGYSQTNEKYVLDTDIIELRTAYDVYDDEGMLMAGIFTGTLAFLGLGVAMVSSVGGIIAIILLLFSSVVMYSMGLMNIGLGGVMFLVVMGIVIIIVISKD